MTRTVSSTAKRAMLARETDEVFLILVTISQEDLLEPIRVALNSEDVTSRSDLFVAYVFDISLPTEEEGSPPLARITLDNVDRSIANALRSMTSPAEFLIEIVRAASPDTVEITYDQFKLSNVQGDLFQISGDITIEDMTVEPFPAMTFNPKNFRGLFA